MTPMTRTERRSAVALAGIFALRMLGLFLILPVFALHAKQMPDATPLLTGIAIGAYGLTQALLQIPAGMLSDRIGRKPVIFAGLVLFAMGSIVAATAEGILGIIVGRAVQGSGAIAAAVMALTADLTREEVRTRAMAGIGMSIGAAFAVALVLGPAISHWVGLEGLFWFSAWLAGGGILILALFVPSPAHSSVHRDAEAVPGQFRGVLANRDLLRLDYGVLTLHMVMTALFLAVPLTLKADGLAAGHHWWVYLPVLVLSVVAMVPFIIQAEGKGRMRPVFLGAVLTLVVALLGLYGFHARMITIALALFLFFTAFNLLEAALPSLVAKTAPAAAKGTAMGVYSTSQFTGAFLGGVLGGWVHQHFGEGGVFLFGAGAALVWFLVAYAMSSPRQVRTQVIRVGSLAQTDVGALRCRLLEVPGVVEAEVVIEEGLAYLKVDSTRLDSARLHAFSAGT